MLIQPYQLQELQFAWCNRIYFRTRTHRRKPTHTLATLTAEELSDALKPYNIELLEFTSTDIEIKALLSLTPCETTSTALSKTKGRISKWLSEHTDHNANAKHLAKGFFAVTTGQSTAAAVEQYLESQPEHHGYADRARPPVFFAFDESLRRSCAAAGNRSRRDSTSVPSGVCGSLSPGSL